MITMNNESQLYLKHMRSHELFSVPLPEQLICSGLRVHNVFEREVV